MKDKTSEIHEAVSFFWGNAEYMQVDGPSGMNNTTVRLLVDGERYILRIYDTHRDMDKALFEHKVLQALNKRRMGFQVPEPVKSLEGGTVVRLPGSGKLAAVYYFIDGRVPDFSVPAESAAFGESAAVLMKVMEEAGDEIMEAMEPIYPPYYMLGSAHPLCPLPEVARFCASPPSEFADLKASLMFLAGEVERMETELGRVRHLPHRLIHGDLNASNALSREEDGTIAALLDFEFATVDLRAMEPAVCLWSLIPKDRQMQGTDAASAEVKSEGGSEADIRGWDSIEAFWKGFSSRMKLLPEELEAIPLLIQLRSLDVFVHFLGRYMDGVDEAAVLAGQIPDTSSRMHWVTEHSKELKHLLRSY
jgi:homoserine kinase type II